MRDELRYEAACGDLLEFLLYGILFSPIVQRASAPRQWRWGERVPREEGEREGASVQSSQLQSTIDSQTVKTLTCNPLLIKLCRPCIKCLFARIDVGNSIGPQ